MSEEEWESLLKLAMKLEPEDIKKLIDAALSLNRGQTWCITHRRMRDKLRPCTMSDPCNQRWQTYPRNYSDENRHCFRKDD